MLSSIKQKDFTRRDCRRGGAATQILRNFVDIIVRTAVDWRGGIMGWNACNTKDVFHDVLFSCIPVGELGSEAFSFPYPLGSYLVLLVVLLPVLCFSWFVFLVLLLSCLLLNFNLVLLLPLVLLLVLLLLLVLVPYTCGLTFLTDKLRRQHV